MSHPPPPWELRGDAFHLMRPISITRARAFVPSDLKIVRVTPGRTIGGIYVARYIEGSTLTYSELLVVPAIVRYGAKIGIWVSHIYVDDVRSMEGGRRIWGLPKEIAEFEWSDRGVEVRREGRLLCSLRRDRVRPIVRLPFPIPALSILDFERSGVSKRRSRGPRDGAG